MLLMVAVDNRCGTISRDDACLPCSVTSTTSELHFSTESIRGLSVLQMTKQLEYGTGNHAHVLGQYYMFTVHACVCVCVRACMFISIITYRITRIFGGHFNLAVWRISLLSPN